MVNWTNIHPDFAKKSLNKTYQQYWEEEGIAYQDAQILISAGFKPSDYHHIKYWKEAGMDTQQIQEWLQVDFKLSDDCYISSLTIKHTHTHKQEKKTNIKNV